MGKETKDQKENMEFKIKNKTFIENTAIVKLDFITFLISICDKSFYNTMSSIVYMGHTTYGF